MCSHSLFQSESPQAVWSSHLVCSIGMILIQSNCKHKHRVLCTQCCINWKRSWFIRNLYVWLTLEVISINSNSNLNETLNDVVKRMHNDNWNGITANAYRKKYCCHKKMNSIRSFSRFQRDELCYWIYWMNACLSIYDDFVCSKYCNAIMRYFFRLFSLIWFKESGFLYAMIDSNILLFLLRKISIRIVFVCSANGTAHFMTM